MSDLATCEWPDVNGPGTMEHHEAGHALVAMAFGFQVRAVSTLAMDSADATTYIEVPIRPTYLDHVKMALVASAGLAAEARFCALSKKTNVGFVGHDGDRRKAYESMNAIGHGDLFLFYTEWVGEFLKDRRVWSALSKLVEMLPERGFLSDSRVISTIASTVPRFEGPIFESTLAIIEEAKKAGILHRIQDSASW